MNFFCTLVTFLIGTQCTALEIKSPGFPQKYGDNVRKEWNFQNDVTLKFSAFDTETCCDKLKIEGSDGTRKEFSGNRGVFTTQVFKGPVKVSFTSDSNQRRKGFQAQVLTKGEQSLRSIDGGEITTPNFPRNYGNNENMKWKIEGDLIRLKFEEFNTEKSVDFLSIIDGKGESHRYHGSVSPFSKTFKGPLTLQFISDGGDTKKGFKIKFSEVDVSCRKKTVVIDASTLEAGGYLTSPGYPSPYPWGTHCRWRFETPNSISAHISVVDMDIGSKDYIEVKSGSKQYKLSKRYWNKYYYLYSKRPTIVFHELGTSHKKEKGFKIRFRAYQ